MESERWKKASLAISSIIRGLELDQVVFQYDEDACSEISCLLAESAFAACRPGVSSSGLDLGGDLHPM